MSQALRKLAKAPLWLGGLLQAKPSACLAFLIYHSVSGRLLLELDLPSALFARQLAFLARSGQLVSYDEAVRSLQAGEPQAERRFVLTFDDGYVDFYTTVFPLLQRHRAPATLFVTTGFVEERVAYPMLSAPHTQVEPVTWEMLGEMAASGLITLGAHTHTYPVLTGLATDRIEEELARPLELFEQRLGIRPHHFAYPRAETSEAGVRLVAQYYTIAVAGGGRVAIAHSFDRYCIPRLPIRRSDGWFFFEATVRGRMANEEALYARLRRLIG